MFCLLGDGGGRLSAVYVCISFFGDCVIVGYDAAKTFRFFHSRVNLIKQFTFVTDVIVSLLQHLDLSSTWCQCHKTFYGRNLLNGPNKLECLYLAGLPNLVQFFSGKAS